MCELFHTQQKKNSGVENMPAKRRDMWKINSTGLSSAGAL